MNSRPHRTSSPVYRWSEGAIVYQIYPRSFQDGNADGVGDLPGITSRLDYIRSLGVNTIWLSPFYPSPMADFGYDVADYCDVDPMFGDLIDFDELLKGAHERSMRLIVDLVPNHTSVEHAWFQASRRDPQGPYGDWYIWRDAKVNENDGTDRVPNNWRNVLNGGPVWEWDEVRGQFYLHSFDKGQPDLNWANPKVRAAMHDVMRFWLDRGVDGFRVDAVYWMAKHPLLADDPENPAYVAGEDMPYDALLHTNSCGWPAVYSYLSEMADVLKEPAYRDKQHFIEHQRFMITEAYPDHHDPLNAYLNFYVGMDPNVAAPFNFEGLKLGWNAPAWRRFLRPFHLALEQLNPACVASYAFGNHDNSRLASRLGPDAARAAAVLLLTLPGMSFIYNGDELGMTDGSVPPELVQDPSADGGHGRDPERTPLQWNASNHAGFSSATRTWLPINNNYRKLNAAAEAEDHDSMLSLYRRLGKLRNHSLVLRHGGITVYDIENKEVLCFGRSKDRREYLVAINFTDKPQRVMLPATTAELMLSSSPTTVMATECQDGGIELAPHEAAVYKHTK